MDTNTLYTHLALFKIKSLLIFIRKKEREGRKGETGICLGDDRSNGSNGTILNQKMSYSI